MIAINNDNDGEPYLGLIGYAPHRVHNKHNLFRKMLYMSMIIVAILCGLYGRKSSLVLERKASLVSIARSMLADAAVFVTELKLNSLDRTFVPIFCLNLRV